MRIGRLHTGELLAAAGAAALFVVLFLDWFGVAGAAGIAVDGAAPSGALHTTGWSALGWFLVVLLVLAMAAAAALALLTAANRPVAQAVAAAIITTVIGGFAALVLLLRLVTQPGLGAGLPNALVDVKPVAWLGFLCALAIPVGGWLALADERTDAPESAYQPPPPRPLPPTAAS
jgi:hypothetical protein